MSGLSSCDPKSHGVSRGDHGTQACSYVPSSIAAALLADVDLAAEVERHRHLVAGRRDVGGDLGHVLGDQVDVLHGEDRQLDADHPPDLARPQAAGVDDVLGVDDVAALDADVPRPVRALRRPTTGVCWWTSAPASWAHFTYARVTPVGSTWPSTGSYSAPTKYCGSISGKRSARLAWRRSARGPSRGSGRARRPSAGSPSGPPCRPASARPAGGSSSPGRRSARSPRTA